MADWEIEVGTTYPSLNYDPGYLANPLPVAPDQLSIPVVVPSPDQRMGSSAYLKKED
jgi:hypothetical protein